MKRVYTREPQPTQKRLKALNALIEAGRAGITLETINEQAGYTDIRVLLLSLAELALRGFVEVKEGRALITEAGREFFRTHTRQQHIQQLNEQAGLI